MIRIDNETEKTLGIIIEENNFISRAQMEFEEIIIEGKDGSEIIPKRFTNVYGTLNIYVRNENNLDRVLNFFYGEKTLYIGSRKTKVRFFDAVPVTRFGIIKNISVSFIRNPFWLSEFDTETKATEVISNHGNIYSKPILKIIGSGIVNVSINNVSFQYDFKDDDCVYIDCDEKTETLNGVSKSKNIKIGYEYPVLEPGENNVSITNGAQIYFSRKDRWL